MNLPHALEVVKDVVQVGHVIDGLDDGPAHSRHVALEGII